MTPEQIIEGLEKAKAWDPRQFIIEACDAAIGYIRDHEAAVAAIMDSAAPLLLASDELIADSVIAPTVTPDGDLGAALTPDQAPTSDDSAEVATPSDAVEATAKKGKK